MEKRTITMKLVEAGLNKYGQRLDEFNEFGQSLEAEAWHFDGIIELPLLDSLEQPPTETVPAATAHANTGKPCEPGFNKYGQRLDEFNEFGLSLEAETWHFDTVVPGTLTPLAAPEQLIRPTQAKKLAVISPAAADRQAA